jgi:hypothetical protein
VSGGREDRAVLDRRSPPDRYVRRRLLVERVAGIVEIVDTALETDDRPTLAQVLDARHALCVWRRPAAHELGAAAEGLMLDAEAVTRERLDAARPDVQRSLACLPPGAERDCLARDLRDLIDLYATITGATQVGARVTVTRGRTCPKFHVDGVGLRLICAWRGPGTEWLAEQDVDRRGLERASPEPHAGAGVARPGAVVRALRTRDVGLFKGAAWPGFARRAIVHRSPEPNGDWRVLLVLDALA